MTDDDKKFLESLDENKRYWWSRNLAKHGSVEAVKEAMSGYAGRRQTIGGFTNPEVLKKAQETRAKNKK